MADTAPVVAALAALSSGELLAFLTRQRWFAAKGASPTSARVVDVVVMPWGDGIFAIACIAVAMAGVEDERQPIYQLPIAMRDAMPSDAPASALIAAIDLGSRSTRLFDAVYDEEFRRGLAGAFATDVSMPASDGAVWRIRSTVGGASGIGIGDRPATRIGSAEQSNTSIIVDDQTILKLFRTLRAGVHPDVEVTEFLTMRSRFPNTPAILGAIEMGREDDVMLAGMLQEYLPGSTDAWSYALEQGRAYFAAPGGREIPNVFLADARQLGAVTRAMHEALASDDDDPAFAPDPVGHEDVDRWAHRTQHTIRDALSLLGRQLSSPKFPRERLPEATALVQRGEHYIARVNEIDDELGEDLGMCTRVHGDFHLGQILRTASGEFMIIDFEGEPSKSLEERREKTSPLRDVAGMLRSIAYAAATLAMSVEKSVEPAIRELRSARWERDVRGAFLSGYLGDPAERDDHPDVLPEEESDTRRLIALFEMEKAFYELTYELNNRPTWSWIPMRGISKLLVA